MNAQITALIVMILGLALYLLTLVAPKVAWLSPLALIMFGVGLFHWLPGYHTLSLR